jgi:hypothetical protein
MYVNYFTLLPKNDQREKSGCSEHGHSGARHSVLQDYRGEGIRVASLRTIRSKDAAALVGVRRPLEPLLAFQ